MNDQTTNQGNEMTNTDLSVAAPTPNYNIQFFRDTKLVGTLDFNGPIVKFEGDADDSATIFFDALATKWPERVKE